MCRVLSYLGYPVLVEDLLYKPDNSFIKQTYHPIYMPHLLNLAGFGLVAWNNESPNKGLPFVYKTDQLPFYDENLRNLTQKIAPSCILSHIRGVPYSDKKIVSRQNVHPFMFPNTNIALAHNGSLYKFDDMKYQLLHYINTENQKHIHGTTDSEWLYAVFLSQFQKLSGKNEIENLITAIIETLTILKKIRYDYNIRVNSPMNLFISNGKFLAATRFVFDYGWKSIHAGIDELAHYNYHSLWYTYGEKYMLDNEEYKMKDGDKKSSIIVASEPLTEDTTSWIEVPEYTLLVATLDSDEIRIISFDIDI